MSDLVIGQSGLLGQAMNFSNQVIKPLRRELDITKNTYSYFSELRENGIKLNDIYVLAAYTNVAKSNLEKQKCYDTNVVGINNIIYTLNNLYPSSRIIYISTDYVFDGEHGNYQTTDPLNPVKDNYYAFTKAMGEGIVKSFVGPVLVIRTSFCRADIWPYEKAFMDQYTSRDTIDVIVPKIKKAILTYYSEILHIGTERKSVYELAKKLNPNVKPCSRLEIKDVNIPYDTSLQLSEI